ncbi:ABC transporter substrate-binding protein [Rhizobium sp. BR 314]|uniref:ABC transporter substrate-binding protein n=1 Tax=Rhizobium sp. BR 314 TaxID=3040013 RepID=UPI0039BF44B6
MITRRTIVGLMSAAAFLGTVGMAHAADKPYIALISKGYQHQFWQAVRQGAEQAAKDLDVTVSYEGPEGESAINQQLDMIQAALAKKPAALGLAALDSQAAIPLVQQAKDAGIPIIAFDSGVDSDYPLTTASTDSKASAALAADKMAELIGSEGEVAIVGHDQTSTTGVDRVEGFKGEIAAKYPKITIVDIQYGGGDHTKSADITKAIIQAHPKLKGIFGTNEGAALGVAIGKKEAESKVVVIGYDSGAGQIDAIKDGTIAGSITQNPVGIGYKTVEAAVKATKGEKLSKHIDTGFYWYDKSNIDDPKIAAVLYK